MQAETVLLAALNKRFRPQNFSRRWIVANGSFSLLLSLSLGFLIRFTEHAFGESLECLGFKKFVADHWPMALLSSVHQFRAQFWSTFNYLVYNLSRMTDTIQTFLCAPKSFCQNKLRISIWSKISCGWSFFELIRCRQALNRGSWIHFSSYIKCHLVAVFDILSESFFGHRSLLIRRLETFWRSFQWEFSTHRRETFKCLLGNV